MMRYLIALLCSFIVTTALDPAVADTNPKLRGVFSGLTYHYEPSDLMGMEIIVVPGPSGNMALIQYAEGAVHQPVLVPMNESAGEASFLIPPACPCGLPAGRYLAVVSLGALHVRGPVGSGEHTPIDTMLSRGKSFWQ
jgi:hypothetical protein